MVPSANNDLLIDVSQLPQAQRYLVAYSGGSDSTALLHQLSQYKPLQKQLFAIHINHHINPQSDQWAAQCQSFCQSLNVPLHVVSVQLADHSENTARMARLKAYEQHLQAGDCLLTAHHQQDQLETILFRILRGTGLHGLTGMQMTRQLGSYVSHKPLLNTPKDHITAYLHKHALPHIQDPSNADLHYRRNFIRHQLLPVLNAFDEQATDNLLLTARNLDASLQLLNHLVGRQNPLPLSSATAANTLSTRLYHWLHALDLSAPTHKQLLQFATDCCQARADKTPRLATKNYDLVRWNQHIHALRQFQAPTTTCSLSFQVYDTNIVDLPADAGQIQFTAPQQLMGAFAVRFQQSQEVIRLSHKQPHHKLKKLFQQHQVPPWQRQIMPYLYHNDQLMAVGNRFKSTDFQALLAQHKAEYNWLSPQLLL